MRYRTPSMMLRIGLGICGALVLGAATAASANWDIGAPIVAYWAGPGRTMAVEDRTVAQLRAGGWNLGWAKTPEDLDVYERHGLRSMLQIHTPDVSDPAQAAQLEALVGRVRNHPALYAYFLFDEPGAGAFPKLGKLVAWLRERDPEHLAYINLLPTYASDGMLQVSDDAAERARLGYPEDFAGIHSDDKTAQRYREHLRQFIAVVQPDLISYDHYHFLRDGDGPQYFLNLALVRSAALAAGKPFHNIVQVCELPELGWRAPGEHEMRWLTYTSLAYGAQGIAHFRYDLGLWQDPPEAITPKPLFWAMARMNREFLAIASELQPLRSFGAYHCGAVMPLGGAALPAESPFKPDPAKQEVLLGVFGKTAERPTHALVVNLDYKNPATVAVNGPGAMEVYHAPTASWRKRGDSSRIALELPPGGGALVRVQGAL